MCRKNKETGLKEKCEARLEAEKMQEEIAEVISEMDKVYEEQNSCEEAIPEPKPEEEKKEEIKSPYVDSCEPSSAINVEIKVTGNIKSFSPEDPYVQTIKALMKAQFEITDKAKADPEVDTKRFKLELLKMAKGLVEEKS